MSGSNEKLRVLRRIPEIRFDEELRGYNKHQVDRVLENLAPLADEVDVLVDRLSEAERRAASAEARVMEGGGPAPKQFADPEPVVPETVAPEPEPVLAPAPVTVVAENFDETLSKTLLLAQRTADATVLEATENAAQINAEAQAEASATREAAEQEAASMRAAAIDERSSAIEQANREVAAMIDAARTTIDAKVAEAEAELAASHATTRDDLVEQITSLQHARDALALDVEHFEGHLSSRREVIRGALAELSEVVEDPERLRTVMPPTAVADIPDMPTAGESQIGVASLDTLANAIAADAEARGVLAPDLSPQAADGVGSWADEDNTWADDGGGHDAAENSSDPDSTIDPDGTTGSRQIDEALESGLLIDAAPDHSAANAVGDDLGEPTQAVPVIVPDDGSSDPFLDELRRATSDEDDDEALSKFLSEDDGEGDGKAGWFGRRK